MNKIEFAAELERLLRDLPDEERKRSVDFYSEMIDDRMEDGESEEAAVAGLGSPRSVADGNISVRSSMGDVEIDLSGAEGEYTVNGKGSGPKKVTAETDLGDVHIGYMR